MACTQISKLLCGKVSGGSVVRTCIILKNWNCQSYHQYHHHPNLLRGSWQSPYLYGSTGGPLSMAGKALYSSSSNKNQDQEDEDLDKPIKFTTSKASKWTSQSSFSGDPFPDAPDWQPYVVIGSVASLLIYFCILREENDFDEEMGKSLWERIPHLERQQLELLIEYNRAHNLGTVELEQRLKEVYEEEAIRKKNAGRK